MVDSDPAWSRQIGGMLMTTGSLQVLLTLWRQNVRHMDPTGPSRTCRCKKYNFSVRRLVGHSTNFDRKKKYCFCNFYLMHEVWIFVFLTTTTNGSQTVASLWTGSVDSGSSTVLLFKMNTCFQTVTLECCCKIHSTNRTCEKETCWTYLRFVDTVFNKPSVLCYLFVFF